MSVICAANGGYARRGLEIGALRAEVGDHEVSVKSADEGLFTKSAGVEVGARTPLEFIASS